MQGEKQKFRSNQISPLDKMPNAKENKKIENIFYPCHIFKITRRIFFYLNLSNKIYFSGSKKPL